MSMKRKKEYQPISKGVLFFIKKRCAILDLSTIYKKKHCHSPKLTEKSEFNPPLPHVFVIFAVS